MQKRDYFEQLIERIAGAIARMMGFVAQKQFAEAEKESLDGAWSGVLGFRRADAARLDDATLRVLLGAKTSLAARLLDAEADILEAKGNQAGAENLRRRASALGPKMKG